MKTVHPDGRETEYSPQVDLTLLKDYNIFEELKKY